MIARKQLDCRPVSFVGAYYLEDRTACDELIDFFRANPALHVRGTVNTLDGRSDRNTDVKDSVEITFYPNATAAAFLGYVRELQKCVGEYINDYPYCDAYSPWTIREGTNVQYYPPGAGYKAWHTERNHGDGVVATRHLVFMTYLNDVTDGGETEFFYQRLRVRPEKGLTLIWPADWTHTHRGVVSPTQEKYIITGWFNYVTRPAA